MEKVVSPPRPDEKTLLDIVTRDVTFPDGRTIHLSISQWHWDMIAFLELWNGYYKREHGILYEFYKQRPNATDQVMSNGLMLLLRDDYNQWLDDTPDGEEPLFVDPRP